jgi:nuclear transport factor 2 (NTF2) superfamily protein
MAAPTPPFTRETAIAKIRMAEDAWNSRDPQRACLAYTKDSQWRNRSEFINGRTEIVAFLTRKWNKELDYRLIKELWAFTDNRIAVRFAYEWHDDSGNWSGLTGTRTGNSMQPGSCCAASLRSMICRSPKPTENTTGRSGGGPTITRVFPTWGYETYAKSGCGVAMHRRRLRMVVPGVVLAQQILAVVVAVRGPNHGMDVIA